MGRVKHSEKENFYYNAIVDDLKIPLTEQIQALMSFLKTAAVKINSEEKELIELVIKSCSYTLKMTEMLNDINSFEEKKLKLNYEEFNFSDLVKEVINSLGIILKYEKVDVEFLNNENSMVYADRNRLMTAVESIFVSMLSFSKPDTTLYVNIQKSKNRLSFELQNKGQIISTIEQKKMYEKYKKAASCFIGSGSNLAMHLTKEIVAAHFGQMILKSSEQGVNVFGFIVPVR